MALCSDLLAEEVKEDGEWDHDHGHAAYQSRRPVDAQFLDVGQ